MADQGLSTDAPAFEAPAAGAGGDAPAEGAEGGVLDAAAAGLNTDAAPFVMPGAAGETAPVSSSVSGYAGLAGRPDMKGIMAAEDYAKELAIVQADPDSPYASAKSFDELGLSAELLKGISLLGYAKPSKIQEVTLPVICTANKKGGFPNLIAQAKNGSGKTAAFVLGMLARCDLTRNVTQSVCLSPTRELAQQNYKAVLDMGVFVKPDVYLAISDVAGQPKLKRGKAIASQIVVGTPGRVKGMIQAKNLSLKDVIVFVLDEADNMVNSKDGLGAQVGGIAKSLSPTCQRLLFSATFEDHVWKFAETFTSRKGERPFTLRLKAEELKIEKLRQYYITVETEQEKMSKLAELYDVLELTYQSIIFVNTIKTATELTTYMRSMGHTCTALHGRGMDKSVRDHVMNEFKAGNTKVLIATNVLARGVDVLGVMLVINYDMPVKHDTGSPDFENYQQRVGRTARFGRKGTSINFICGDKDKQNLIAQREHYSVEIEECLDIEKLEVGETPAAELEAAAAAGGDGGEAKA